jgi:hypothetical protein
MPVLHSMHTLLISVLPCNEPTYAGYAIQLNFVIEGFSMVKHAAVHKPLDACWTEKRNK